MNALDPQSWLFESILSQPIFDRKKKRILATFDYEGGKIVMESLPEGKLFVSRIDKTGKVCETFLSQPLFFRYCGDGTSCLYGGLSFENGKFTIRLYSRYILLEDGPKVPLLSVDVGFFGKGLDVKATERIDAIGICQQSINDRKVMFASRKIRVDRTLITDEEEAKRFSQSMRRIRDLHSQVARETGSDHMVALIIAELRSNLCFNRGGRADNMSPFLLRMANKADLPLPVYYVPTRVVSLQSKKISSVNFNPVSLTCVDVRYKLADLQEWLSTSIVELPDSNRVKLTPNELIAEIAHTEGTSHYDDQSSIFVTALSGFGNEDRKVLEAWILSLALVTADLGDWVLQQLTP